ncbi:hypothetical protein J1N35_040668 [Gossypium stocksii]|uniref:Uncharacterized protein n=1 Tax=Gossypium stocksii TaxID=47602 RepID=A0A9D3UE51_9ROSI|nr:hypothetical protein J1N35_040668 [Gossypium stocksii]
MVKMHESDQVYNSSGVRNVFHRHPRSSMTCTRLTCGGDSRKVDQHSTRTILRCGSAGITASLSTVSFKKK